MQTSNNDSITRNRMLIVDDSNIIRRRIERSCSIDGLVVVGTAGNGREALEVFRETRPHLVTMDLTMPEMGGIECVEQMVALDESIRILVVSALTDKATAIEALKRGANGFLCKPFTDVELNAALWEILHDVPRGSERRHA